MMMVMNKASVVMVMVMLVTIGAENVRSGKQNVFFKVYKDKDCTVILLKDHVANMTVEPCFVGSYVDPNGKVQTNANANFDCENNKIYWTQYPGSSTCSPPSGSLCINATLSTSCQEVQTHMGVTYQKLVNFTGCKSKYTGPRCT